MANYLGHCIILIIIRSQLQIKMNPTKLLLCGLFLFATNFATALESNDCPVCFSIVDRLYADVTKDGAKATKENVSASFLHLCDTADKGSAESKFCYYMGGQDVSATRTYKEMAERMSWGLPTGKICEHLRTRDTQICEIRERKPIDLKTVDLKKLKVVELRRLLKDRGESCDDCVEKSEFIRKAEEIKAREEL